MPIPCVSPTLCGHANNTQNQISANMTLRLPHVLPTLHTAIGRFILSPFTDADVEPLAHILANDGIWAQGFGHGDHRPGGYDELVAFIQRRHESLRIFAIHYTGLPGGPLFVGTTGIIETDPGTARVKIGRTVISPAFWGMQANHEVKRHCWSGCFPAALPGSPAMLIPGTTGH